jgi:hypothetical protein
MPRGSGSRPGDRGPSWLDSARDHPRPRNGLGQVRRACTLREAFHA